MFYTHDRESVQRLAEVWDPNIPSSENAAYVARSRELEKELEAALLNRVSEADQKKSA